MASGLLIFPGAQPSRSRDGSVVSAELRFYLNETTTPAVVYTDEALEVPHAFPIISDDAGRFPLVWADTANFYSCNWSTAAPDSQSVSFDDLSTTLGADVDLLDSMNGVLSDAMDLYESLADVDAAVTEAQGYAAQAAASATGSAGTNATSTTSLLIGSGSKTLTVQSGKLFVAGMSVSIAYSTLPNNAMTGIVQSYDASTGALVVDVTTISGSGTWAVWTVSLSALNPQVLMVRSARTSNTILGRSDRRTFVEVTSGTFTQTLEPSSVLESGWYCYYANSGSGVVTIDPDSAETLNVCGVSRTTLTVNPGEIFILQADGANAFNGIPVKTDPGPHVVVQDQKASATAGGSATALAWTTRTLNTVVTNLVGASLATNAVTLPAGTWLLEATAPFQGTATTQIRIRNVTDASTAAVGRQALIDNTVITWGQSSASARVTIATAKAFSIEYYAAIAAATNGLGAATNSGEIGIFAEFRATRIV